MIKVLPAQLEELRVYCEGKDLYLSQYVRSLILKDSGILL